MTDMSGEQEDITEYIESGNFKPEYCEGRIDRLIKSTPKILSEKYEDTLQIKLENWRNEYNKWLTRYGKDTLNIEIKNLSSNTKYQYSYLVSYNLVYDVYRTDTDKEINGNKNFSFFIRIDQNGNFVDDQFKEDGWVINSCGDYKNSQIQNIYGK